MKDKRVRECLIATAATALIVIVAMTPVLSNFALAQLLPKKLVLVMDVDCPVLVLRCFSHHALANIMSSTPHDPEAVGVLAHTHISASVISFAPSGITDFTVSLPPPVHGLAVNVIVPSTIGTHTNDCRKSGELEVTGTIPPFSLGLCRVNMDVHPLGNISAGGNVPLDEGGSNANGGNANGGNGGNANGGNANSGEP